MRILFLGNNSVGWQVLRWLREQDEDIVGLVLHPQMKRKFGDEMLAAAQVDSRRVFDGSHLRQPDVIRAIYDLQPDIGLSVYFGYILKHEFLQLFPQGCLNLHPALLPYNRGAYPNVWSIIEGTPAGVTLHYVDEGVDTGDIVTQREVAVEPVDTGATLYRKLEDACLQVFSETWPLIKAGRAPRYPQPQQGGTVHRAGDVKGIDEIDVDRSYKARDLINLLRGRTFLPHRGAYFVHKGRKVYLNLHLQYEDQP